jgi:hypothetical protein
MVGEMIRFSFTLKSVTYSSKFKVIFLGEILVEESFGKANTNLGGKLSLGPPPGGMMLAHELAQKIIINELHKTSSEFFTKEHFI